MSRTLHPADSSLSEPGDQRGLDVSANLGMYELESVVLNEKLRMTGFEMRDTVETGDTAGPGSRVESDCRAGGAADADAVVGGADCGPEAWAVPLLSAVLAEARAAGAGQWVWLGGTESESAAGSWSEV